jgi:hypothetical protein
VDQSGAVKTAVAHNGRPHVEGSYVKSKRHFVSAAPCGEVTGGGDVSPDGPSRREEEDGASWLHVGCRPRPHTWTLRAAERFEVGRRLVVLNDVGTRVEMLRPHGNTIG